MGYSDEVLADAPGIYYRLNESSGNAQDSSGNARHITTVAGTPDYSKPGALTTDADTAIGFVRASSESMLTTTAFNVGDTFTIEAWCKLASLGNDQAIAQQNSGMELRANTSNQLELLHANVASIVVSTITLTTGVWYHVVATKAGSIVKLYIDGADRTGAVVNTTIPNGTDFIVARQQFGENWDGDIDEVAFYSTALPLNRILAHFNAGLGIEPQYMNPRNSPGLSGPGRERRHIHFQGAHPSGGG
jgi:hypothetical protein